METHDHQSRVDATMAQAPPATPIQNVTSQAPEPSAQAMPGQSLESQVQTSPPDGAQTVSPGPSSHTAVPDQQGQTVSQYSQAQAAPADAAQAASVDPSIHTGIPNQQGQTISQSPQAQAAGQQAQFQPNVIMDPATGQLYYAIPQGQPVQPPPQYGQYAYYTAQAPPEQAPEPPQPDYAQIIKSVEDFAEGDASVSDVIKTLWTETSQDDQFWKGAVLGAATAVLLTSETVRSAMGKTFGSLFEKKAADTAAASSSPAPDVDPKTE